MMAVTLQAIFQKCFDSFSRTHRLSPHHRRAAQAIIHCRTLALGGHVRKCPNGHVEGVWYNSCGHRSCPQCSHLPKERWLEKQKARLLGCDHYHVILTVAHEFHQFWWSNRRLMVEVLFQSARDTLFELLHDDEYLGALPAVVISVHTWGRALGFHLHVHCLVTGGGLNSAGRWIAVRNGYLLPGKVVRDLFRGKFIAGMRKALSSGKLVLPDGMRPQQAENLFNKVGRKKWNVCIRERYSHGSGVVTYLARYVRGGPISNQRLSCVDEKGVTFRYQDHRDGKVKPMTLSSEEFVQRVLWHVPEKGMQVMRHYGLYGRQGQELREKCRAQLDQLPEEKPTTLDVASYWEKTGHPEKMRCAVCGELLIRAGRVPRGGAPPRVIYGQAA